MRNIVSFAQRTTVILKSLLYSHESLERQQAFICAGLHAAMEAQMEKLSGLYKKPP